MTQPIDIITNALVNIGAQVPGEAVDANIAAFAFQKLNNQLDVWSNDDFTIISVNEIIATVTGKTAWTIGPSASDIITPQRPLAINSAFVRVGTLDYPVQVMNIEQFELIGLKSLQGPWVRALWYNSGTPNGTINVWPLPSSGEIHLFCDLLFTQFATMYDTIQLTQGYVSLMEWKLSELLMPSFGRTEAGLLEMVRKNAKDALGSIKGTNMKPQQTVSFDPILMAGRHKADPAWIYSGGFV